MDEEGVPSIEEEREWELEQLLEPENLFSIEFDYYYTLSNDNPYQDSYTWNEMSYHRECTSWDAIELTELELFELEEGRL
jgi:hypothetical protein